MYFFFLLAGKRARKWEVGSRWEVSKRKKTLLFATIYFHFFEFSLSRRGAGWEGTHGNEIVEECAGLALERRVEDELVLHGLSAHGFSEASYEAEHDCVKRLLGCRDCVAGVGRVGQPHVDYLPTSTTISHSPFVRKGKVAFQSMFMRVRRVSRAFVTYKNSSFYGVTNSLPTNGLFPIWAASTVELAPINPAGEVPPLLRIKQRQQSAKRRRDWPGSATREPIPGMG